MHNKKTAIAAFIVAAIVVILDQWSKYWALNNISENAPIVVTPFFNFVITFNQGAAFSFLGSQSGWQRYFLGALAICVSIWLIWIILTSRDRLQIFSLALILGGAIGNLIDRFYIGSVVDFIDWHIGTAHWPAFNVADIGITVGVVLLLIDGFFRHKPIKEKK